MIERLPTTRASTDVAEYIHKLSAGLPATAATTGRGRLIFALDATGSREPTWDRASQLTHEMFDATTSLGGLDLQLVYYRGYDECRASRWVPSAAALHQLMRQVRCEAGTTQIERVLLHTVRAASERKVNGLVFIGDATEELLDPLCQKAGELGRLGVPIFAFQEGVDPSAATAFRQIADLSHGAYFSFDLASAHRLRELLGAVVAYATAGRAALESYAAKQGGDVLKLTAQLGR
jgi:hypothetical protein